MPVITSIEPQIKDKQRCNVYIDGRFYCGIKLEVAIKYALKAGTEIEKSRLDEIQLETEKAQALDKAMAHISATMKTESQIKKFLASKGYVEAVCEYVLEKLRYYGFVDDYAYCKAYAGSVSGKGKRAIAAELFKRGAPSDAIDSALSEIEEDGGEIRALLAKYMRGKENTRQNLYKASRYLVSKGYDPENVREALGAYSDDEDN